MVEPRSGCCAADPPHIACEQVTQCVQLSAAHGNSLSVAADAGLYVPTPAQQGPLTAGRGIAVTVDTPTSTSTVAVRASTDAGNALSFGADGGLYLPASGADGIAAAADTATVALELTAGTLSAQATISAAADNLLTVDGGGLYAPAADLDPSALVSADPGNSLTVGADGGLLAGDRNQPGPGPGLYTDAQGSMAVGAGPAVTVTDTVTLVVSADAGNRAALLPDGLHVPASTVDTGPTATSDTPTVDLDLAGGRLTGAAVVSTEAGNVLAVRGDGLFVAAGAPLPPPAGLVSGDAANRLTIGTDARLHIPAAASARPGAGGGLVYDAVNTQLLKLAPGPGMAAGVKTAVTLSTDVGNGLSFGADGGLKYGGSAAASRRVAMTGKVLASPSLFTHIITPNSFATYPLASWSGRTGPLWVGVPFGHQVSGADHSIIIDEDGLYKATMTMSYQWTGGGTQFAFIATVTTLGGTSQRMGGYAYCTSSDDGPTRHSIQRWTGKGRLSAGDKVYYALGAGAAAGSMTLSFQRIIIVLEKIGA